MLNFNILRITNLDLNKIQFRQVYAISDANIISNLTNSMGAFPPPPNRMIQGERR